MITSFDSPMPTLGSIVQRKHVRLMYLCTQYDLKSISFSTQCHTQHYLCQGGWYYSIVRVNIVVKCKSERLIAHNIVVCFKSLPGA